MNHISDCASEYIRWSCKWGSLFSGEVRSSSTESRVDSVASNQIDALGNVQTAAKVRPRALIEQLT